MPAIAYNPKLYLLDSNVAIYKIYVLKNPTTNEIFYVGQTMKELEERLKQHISETEVNKEKTDYIQNILSEGKRPLIESVEVIRAICYIDRLSVNEREIYWIKYYKALGCNLLNKALTNPDQECREYRLYLSSIKRGESSYHYYYCGKTASGIPVYDEERLRADGFRLPIDRPLDMSSIQVGYKREYNPWNNPRWVDMILKGEYNYEVYDKTVYKDLDPEIYEQDNCSLFY